MTLLIKAIRHINDLGTYRIRDADAAECYAAGMTVAQAMAMSIELSKESYAIYKNGEMLCVWGFAPNSFITGVVRVWLFSSPAAEKHKTLFARTSRRVAASLLSMYSKLQVSVHEDHNLSLKWLRWLGFLEVARLNGFSTMEKA